jgi:DNA-binding NarL/FixJ family response regulator
VVTVARDHVIVIVDDHALMGEVLALTLRQRGFDAYYLCAIGVTTERITSVDPDLVLLDIAFGDNSRGGIELLRQLRDRVPLVAMLTGSEDRMILAEAMAQGARGIIGKHESVEHVVARVDTLFASGWLATPAEREQAVALLASTAARKSEREARLRSLTERERSVLEQVSSGASVVDIARRECLSLATVRTHVRAILQKLDVHSQVAAVAFYLERS